VSVVVNSQDVTQLQIAARLGYWYGETTGTAWFDDIELTKVGGASIPLQETGCHAWKILALIYRETDLDYLFQGSVHHLTAEMTDMEVLHACTIVGRLPDTINEWSAGAGRAVLTIVYPTRPIQSVSAYGTEIYWASPDDVRPELDQYASQGTYDSVIVVWKADDGEDYVPCSAWGLSLDGPYAWSNGAGYSVVYTPSPSDWWWWNGPHPEEVFVHEWLHPVIGFNASEGCPVPHLDAPESYGYQPIGGTWETWYRDLMQAKVQDPSQGLIGITSAMWQYSILGYSSPCPNPMTWSVPPHATSGTSVEMTATAASDPSGVEYNFEETTGHPGGTSSGWQDSSSYGDTELQGGGEYCYRVKARGKSPGQQETEWSSSETAFTGTVSVFRVTPWGAGLADGAFYGAGFHSGSADVAELVPVSEVVEPGAVLELDTVHPGGYRPSQTACSALVAGVVSSQPGMILGGTPPAEGMALLALTGIVPVKVTDEGGSIQPGDLLVSSSTPGYAMRWTGDGPCPCALVGKALGSMTDRRGMILALLTAH
jgi:hypothetical protein